MSVGIPVSLRPPLPLSLFLASHSSPCRGGGILACFVKIKMPYPKKGTARTECSLHSMLSFLISSRTFHLKTCFQRQDTVTAYHGLAIFSIVFLPFTKLASKERSAYEYKTFLSTFCNLCSTLSCRFIRISTASLLYRMDVT